MLLVRSASLFLGVLFFLATIARAELQEKEWWETTLVYQIFPRAFQDSNGDGEGDLQGIISRLGHIKDLGVETIWLNPIYPSPLVDAGFDVSNYTDIHPLFGTLQDFDELLDAVHNLDLKLILDIEINHSSDQHDWFNSSVYSVEPYTDYYIWRNGTIVNGSNVPPNNWAGHFTPREEGSAWTWNNIRQQWYYNHLNERLPDLNLRNEAVVEEIWAVLDFWLERGVDGFRFGAVPHFFENEDLLDNPANSTIYTFGLEESVEFLYGIRSHIDSWTQENDNVSKMLVAEVYDSDEKKLTYFGNSTHNGIPPFNFRFITDITSGSDASDIKESLDTWIQQLPDNVSTNWMVSNHDYPRAASRFALNRVDGLNMLNLLLPGQAYTYYGDEIGMLDTSVSWSESIDFLALAHDENTYAAYSRDPARTPMQWDNSTSGGFSTNGTTFLPVNSNYLSRNVESQLSSSSSNIQTYKALASIRKQPTFTHGDYEIAATNDNRVLVLLRYLAGYPTYLCVINLSLARQTINLTALYNDLPETLYIAILSNNAILTESTVSTGSFQLTANAAVVLTDVEPETTTEATTTEIAATEQETTIDDTETTKATTTEGSTDTGSSASMTTATLAIILSICLVALYDSS